MEIEWFTIKTVGHLDFWKRRNLIEYSSTIDSTIILEWGTQPDILLKNQNDAVHLNVGWVVLSKSAHGLFFHLIYLPSSFDSVTSQMEGEPKDGHHLLLGALQGMRWLPREVPTD